jgi:hypothetical protein
MYTGAHGALRALHGGPRVGVLVERRQFGARLGLGRGGTLRFARGGPVVRRVRLLPVDLEAGHPRLRRQDVPDHLVELRGARRVLAQLLVGVLVVDKVPHPDELLRPVRASQQHHGHPDGVVLRDPGHVGGVGLEHEHVLALGDRPHHHRVQDLVVLLALRRPHVDHLPLEICNKAGSFPEGFSPRLTFFQFFDALEGDLELERVRERTGIVHHCDVAKLNFCHSRNNDQQMVLRLEPQTKRKMVDAAPQIKN